MDASISSWSKQGHNSRMETVVKSEIELQLNENLCYWVQTKYEMDLQGFF
jgi:hypothetical protein